MVPTGDPGRDSGRVRPLSAAYAGYRVLDARMPRHSGQAASGCGVSAFKRPVAVHDGQVRPAYGGALRGEVAGKLRAAALP